GSRRAAALLAGGAVADASDAALAGRLVGAGLAHPLPPLPSRMASRVVCVVPVRDRADALDRCLAGLAGAEVVVVDDASADAGAIASVASRHGARLLRLADNRGPAGARNAGCAAVDPDVETVAFIDSDCTVATADIEQLTAHLADPEVVAVAPRIRPAGDARSTVQRFAAGHSPLDLGPCPADVRPGGRVAYVPTTVLVVRRQALDLVGGFDEALRVGEDVDLCWRLVDAGGVVRYEPDVVAHHDEPQQWTAWLARRFRYGTSAGALAPRHTERLSGPPLSGLLALYAIDRERRRGRIPAEVAREVASSAPRRPAVGLLRWAVPVWTGPVLLVAVMGRRRRLAVTSGVAVLLPLLEDARQPAAGLGRPRRVAAALLDDVAYGAGVWCGSVRARTWWPLVPRISGGPRTPSP
ncbi:MAG: glycosyltransferase, partial [Frankiales bacterium]|nr:glycosyltransferase [Frankiales bacterium]